MNMTGEHVPLRVKRLFLVCVLVLSGTNPAFAQYLTATNWPDLAGQAFDGSHSIYLPWTGPSQWRAFSLDGGEPAWVCSDMLQICTNLSSTNLELHGMTVAVTPIRLTKDVLTGIALVQSTDTTNIIASISAPSGYYPGMLSEDRGVLFEYSEATNCPDCWGLSITDIPSPTVTLTVNLADLGQYAVYASNLEAEADAEAEVSSGSSFTTGSRFTAMFEDDESDPCTITNETDPFSIVSVTVDGQGCNLSWSSCTDHVYIVQTESSLTPAPSWTDAAWMFGSDGTSTWTDTNAVGQTQGFYRVVRASPNQLNNGIPYGWAVTYGLDPLDPNLDSEDPDGDGYSNYAEFVNGTDPLHAEPPLDILVNGGNAYTASLTIPVLPLSTNYPEVLVSVSASMTNAVALGNTGVATNYTLSDSEGPHYLYFQYADTQAQPHSAIIPKTIAVDRVAPTVQITAPASNAVLDQAFITLQGIAFDPDPVLTPDARPLKIWINDQPYWGRFGTNITVKRFPVPAGTNSFTVTIRAVDDAGNSNQVSRTWTVDSSGDMVAPQLSSFNIATNTLLPDVEQIWVQGAVDDTNAIVNAVVNANDGVVTTNTLSVRDLQFEGLVPLEFGTNQLVLLAFDAAGNASSNAFTIIRSNRYRFQITSPAFDVFATAPSNYVSGYVSAKFDEGLPTETNVTSVLINGVAAVLGTNVDANGNLSFTTTNAIPLGVPITGFIAGPGIPTDPPPDPPTQDQEYEVLHKDSYEDNVSSDANRPEYNYYSCADSCPGNWWTITTRWTLDAESFVAGPTEQDHYSTFVPTGGHCKADPHPETFSWQTTYSNQSTCIGTNPPSGGEGGGCTVDLSKWLWFGTIRADGSGWSSSHCYDAYGYETKHYQVVSLPRQTMHGAITFRAPRSYDTNTTVVFTFEGVDYGRSADEPLDLSQIKYLGQNPITWSNETQTVSYLLTVDGGKEYTVNQDSFDWPTRTYQPAGEPFPVTQTDHWMIWTNFHNEKLRVQLSSSDPTNVCVSYTYQNTHNSPANTLIAVTNQIPLTATGSPDDGTGVYTWSHSRGGTFSTNGTHAASTVTYSAPDLASATPANTRDAITVTYTYHGGSCSTNATLNILRPKTLVVTGYGVVAGGSPDCSATNGTSFQTAIEYNIKDQFGNLLGGPTGSMAIFETFDTFSVGSPVVATNGPLSGIQVQTLDGFPNPHLNDMITPGQTTLTTTWFGDKFYRNSVEAGTNEVFWNSTSASNPALKMNQKLTLQGAEFSTVTIIWYCDGAASPPSGAKLLRGGSEPTVGAQINANN